MKSVSSNAAMMRLSVNALPLKFLLTDYAMKMNFETTPCYIEATSSLVC